MIELGDVVISVISLATDGTTYCSLRLVERVCMIIELSSDLPMVVPFTYLLRRELEETVPHISRYHFVLNKMFYSLGPL
jgi:hypothetical protein